MSEKKKRKRGGQTRLDRKRASTLLKAVAAGNYLETACAFAGVHPVTVLRWRRRGEDELARVTGDEPEAELIVQEWLDGFDKNLDADNPMWVMDPPTEGGWKPDEWIFVLFSQLLENARARAEVGALQRIRRAASGPNGEWRAEAWFLERTQPQKYGRKILHAVQGVEGAPPVQVTASHTVEGLMERVSAILGTVDGAKELENVALNDKIRPPK
jgi:hypothetical protein